MRERVRKHELKDRTHAHEFVGFWDAENFDVPRIRFESWLESAMDAIVDGMDRVSHIRDISDCTRLMFHDGSRLDFAHDGRWMRLNDERVSVVADDSLESIEYHREYDKYWSAVWAKNRDGGDDGVPSGKDGCDDNEG